MKRLLLLKRVDVIAGVVLCLLIPLRKYIRGQVSFAGHEQYYFLGVFLSGSILLNLFFPRQFHAPGRKYFIFVLAAISLLAGINFLTPTHAQPYLCTHRILISLIDFYPIISGWLLAWYFFITSSELLKVMKADHWGRDQLIVWKKTEVWGQIIVLGTSLLFLAFTRQLGYILITYALSALLLAVFNLVHFTTLKTYFRSPGRKVLEKTVFLVLGTFSMLVFFQIIYTVLRTRPLEGDDWLPSVIHTFGILLFVIIPLQAIWYFELTISELRSLKREERTT